jgi:hypothetical protein
MDVDTLETFDSAEASPLENIDNGLSGVDVEFSEDGNGYRLQAEDDSWFENTDGPLFGDDVDISADGAPDTDYPFGVDQ